MATPLLDRLKLILMYCITISSSQAEAIRQAPYVHHTERLFQKIGDYTIIIYEPLNKHFHDDHVMLRSLYLKMKWYVDYLASLGIYYKTEVDRKLGRALIDYLSTRPTFL